RWSRAEGIALVHPVDVNRDGQLEMVVPVPTSVLGTTVTPGKWRLEATTPENTWTEKASPKPEDAGCISAFCVHESFAGIYVLDINGDGLPELIRPFQDESHFIWSIRTNSAEGGLSATYSPLLSTAGGPFWLE